MSYKRIQDLLDLALWMQSEDEGVSIQDIMDKFQVSKRTAVRMKDMIKERFPQIKQHTGPHNFKRWYIPKGTLSNLVTFLYLFFKIIALSILSKKSLYIFIFPFFFLII